MGSEVDYSGEFRIEPPVPTSGIDPQSLRVLTAPDGEVYTLAFIEPAPGERALAALICGDNDYGSAKRLRWETCLYTLVGIAQAAGSAITGQMTYRDEQGESGVAEIDASGNLEIRVTPDHPVRGRSTPTPSAATPGTTHWGVRSVDGAIVGCDSEATAVELHSHHPHLSVVSRTPAEPWHTTRRGATAIPGPAADAMALLWSSRELADRIAPLLRCDEVAALSALLASLGELGAAARWSASHADAHGNCLP